MRQAEIEPSARLVKLKTASIQMDWSKFDLAMTDFRYLHGSLYSGMNQRFAHLVQ
jgi:hypothetical protein